VSTQTRGPSNFAIFAVGGIVVICLLVFGALLFAASQGFLKFGAAGTNTAVAVAPTPLVVVITNTAVAAAPTPLVVVIATSPATPVPAVAPSPTVAPTLVVTAVVTPTATVTPTLNASDLITQADALTYQSKFADAGALYQQVLQMDPTNALASAHWARALLIQGDLEARGELITLAVTKAETAAQLAPTNSEAAIWQSRAYDWNGNYDKALIAAQKAAQLAPNSAQVNAVLAEALSENGKSADADAAAQRALQLDPNNADAHRIAGALHYNKQQVQAAIAEFEKAAQIEPNLALRQLEVGVYYRLAKVYDKATDAFQKAIALYPNTARAYAGLGQAFLEQKQYDQAIANFTQATQINDTYADAFYYLGRSNDATGNCDQAIPEYQQTINLNSKSNLALTYLGMCQLKAGNLPAAADAAQKAAAIDPNFADTQSLLAALAVALATPTPAIPPGLYVTGIRMDPPSPGPGQVVSFYATFLNTNNSTVNLRWLVYIHKADAPNSFGETASIVASFPPGTGEQKASGTWTTSCARFIARAKWLDDNKKATIFQKPDGQPFELPFSIC
jgi:tetratricopeptide (TPR) repeat protein